MIQSASQIVGAVASQETKLNGRRLDEIKSDRVVPVIRFELGCKPKWAETALVEVFPPGLYTGVRFLEMVPRSL